MKKSTKIGWVMVTLALVMTVWVFTSHSSEAEQTVNGCVLNDDGTVLESYQGSGGAVTVPDGVTTINSGVFANNTSITSVTLPNSVTTLGSRVFSGATNLRNVSLGRVTSIPASTFQNCMSLTSVSIPSTVTGIGSQAFYGCAALGSVSVPSSVSSISQNAFGECNNLTSIAASNSFYSSYDGCLYNAGGTRLILVPPGKSSVSFADSARTIGAGAFSYNRNISSVTIPDTIDAIESGAFSGSAVSSITIPASVTSIASQGSWKPGELYGYQGSAAETFANSNGITFIALDPGRGSTDNGGITNNDDPEDPANDPSGSRSTANKNKSTGSGARAVAGGSGAAASRAGGRGTSYNGKDVTPKTADGDIDPRYIICAVILLLGIFIMVSGNHRKYMIVRRETKERA